MVCGKEQILSAQNPEQRSLQESYNKRIESILQKLIAKRIVPWILLSKRDSQEYGFVMKQFSTDKRGKGIHAGAGAILPQ